MLTLERYDYQRLDNGVYLARLLPSSANDVCVCYHKDGSWWVLKGQPQTGIVEWQPILSCLILWTCRLPENLEDYAEAESGR